MAASRQPSEQKPERMAPLARLPVFLALAGKRAVLVGEGQAAAWKAELLEAAGARVETYAADGWTAEDLRGAAVAVGAFEGDEKAAAFAAAARSVGVPVNVIDKPAYCDFSFGAIVNRSPLVIGISTDGAAPVFAQAIRAKLEALLPTGFAGWAAAAARWRSRLKLSGLSFAGRRKFWQIAGTTGLRIAPENILAAARQCGFIADDMPLPEQALLAEGWATAAGYEIASKLSDGTGIDVDALIAAGRLPDVLRAWLTNLLVHLEAAGLTRQSNGTWLLIPDTSLPGSASVLKALADESRSHAAELLLAGSVMSLLRELGTNGGLASAPDSILSKAALDFYDSSNTASLAANGGLSTLLRAIEKHWPKDRSIRVLQVGAGQLAKALASYFGDRAAVTIFEPDRRRYELAERGMPASQGVTLIDGGQSGKLAEYDLVVSVGGLHRLPPELGLLGLRALLAPYGLLVAVEPQASLFNDLVFGLSDGWFAPGNADYPIGALQSPEQWMLTLEQAGFAKPVARTAKFGADIASLLVAAAGDASAEQAEAARGGDRETSLFVASPAQSPLALRLAELARKDLDTNVVYGSLLDFPDLAPEALVWAAPSAERPGDPVKALTERCLDIKRCAEKIGDAKSTLWLVFAGALAAGPSPVRPVETGAWAFSRTLANEFPNLDIRRIDVDPNLEPEAAAARIAKVIASKTAETELRVAADAIKAVRIQSFRRTSDQIQAQPSPAARLQRRTREAHRLAWQPIERKRPGADEVEIGVEATGVNFRDLMWTLSLLPDDMLEDGFTGPTLGLECAGRVTQVGSAVKALAVGDRVAAFAASAFSTHVTVPAAQAVKLPAGLSCEDAATIPVAFVTAHYSLMTLAKLRPNEWVLIHGGAGGVGMAAIQIAQARGARIIATAGSRAKRGLLRAVGVEHVLDSRSTSFVDEVRAITGSGVDVVLNSLAGEAMERSIACLRPFGRFVELGKRDYVANTHIGLRPFRKNLSYFGVDVDQLIGGRRGVGERIYADIMRQLAKGTYRPLPYSVFEAGDVAEAFHLMQHSGHVGKIVVRPPLAGSVRAAGKPPVFSAQGTHLITGAFGGFGLETAKWLVDRGVRHLVLVGRRGAASAEAKAAVREFTDRGVKVLAEACDIADQKAVDRLFEKIHGAMPPVVGVMHAAMVLDDAAIVNLDAERFQAVLAPKVQGADNLDVAVRGLALDYFVMFSSVTTLIGNPGQGNYVAANAYMEGLARRRRQQGLPALAIGWGPITDVGVVARSQKLKSTLQKITGASGMRAREALDLMAQALAQPADADALAVMTISPKDGSFTSDRLPVLRSPTYAALVSDAQGYAEGDAGKIDLHALIQSDGVEVARRKVADVIVAQLARVLHSREEDISRSRPLAEIGLDSLMALELVFNLEECFGIHVALSGSAGALTVSAVADEVIAHIDSEHGRDEAMAATLAEQHVESVDAGQVAALKELMNEEATNVKRLLN